MKGKSLYIYLGAVIIIVAAIFIYDSLSGGNPVTVADTQSSGMPNDDIHKGLGGDAPSAGNVKSEFMQRYNNLKEKYNSNPKDTAVAKEYAMILSQAHRKPKAIEIFNDIIKIDPSRTDILLMLGFEYYGMQDYEKAEKVTAQLLKYDKDNAQAKYNLGAINLAMGKTETARKYWKEVVEKHPGSEAARYAEDSLGELEGKGS